jgi:hypothetical protein
MTDQSVKYKKWSDPVYVKEYFKKYYLEHRPEGIIPRQIYDDIIDEEEREKIKEEKKRLNKIRIKGLYKDTRKKALDKYKSKSYHCDVCNCDMRNGGKYRHNKTIKHLTNLEKNDDF